jgi:hypothetical protein
MKIGTGEGAQAYGHGLYLAENPGVATDYAKTLGPKTALSNPEYVAAGTSNFVVFDPKHMNIIGRE